MTRDARMRMLSGGLAALLVACVQSQDFPAPEGAAPDEASLPPPACGSLDDPDNCGACGHSCLGGTCARGQCQPVVLAEGQGDTLMPDSVDVDASHVMWFADARLRRVPIGGGDVEELGRFPQVRREKLRAIGDHVYMETSHAIVRVSKSGGALEKVTPALADATGVMQTFDVVDGAIAWSASRAGADGVYRSHLFLCSLPCTTPEEPWGYEGGPSPRAIGRSAKNLYASYAFDDPETQGEGVDCLTASYKPALVTNFFNEIVVEEMPDEAFAYGASMGAVARARLPVDRPDGNQPYIPDKVLASDPEMMPRSLLLVENDLYWADSTPAEPGSIFRVDKRGISLPENILSGWKVIALAATERAIYFKTSDGKIAKLARPAPVVEKKPDDQR